MKKMAMSLLCSLSVFTSFGIGVNGINMSRVKAQLEQATKEFYLIQESHEKAMSDLMTTPKGVVYKKNKFVFEKDQRDSQEAFDKGERNTGRYVHESRYLYYKAQEDLYGTKEYREDFLPIDKKLAHIDYKRRGLQKMLNFLEDDYYKDPIHAMHLALHLALYVDKLPYYSCYKPEIQGQVEEELHGLIKSEAQEFAIDKTERLMNN